VKPRTVVLLTVVGPAGREDVVVASDVPVFHLLPALTELVGGSAAPVPAASSAARWHVRHADRTLPVTRSLQDSGVLDGQELHLTPGVTR
jgi:WXG100 protein secretion system (Wss), protein YukD